MKKNTKKTIAIIFSLVLVCLLSAYCISFQHNKIPYFKELPIESSDNTAFMLYDSIYVNNKAVRLDKLLSKSHPNISLEKTLCVYGDGIYLLCQNQNSDRLLVRVDMQKDEVRELCLLKHSDKQDELKKVFSTAPYEEQTAYYHQGKIILHNKETVLLFDIKTETVEQTDFQEFQPQKQPVMGEVLDDKTIQITIDENVKKISLEDISQSSKSFASLYNKKDQKTWSKDVTRFGYFLHQNSLQIMENTVFLVGQYRNFNGSVIAVILQYDYSAEEWKYVTSLYTDDIIVSDLYMVPYVEESPAAKDTENSAISVQEYKLPQEALEKAADYLEIADLGRLQIVEKTAFHYQDETKHTKDSMLYLLHKASGDDSENALSYLAVAEEDKLLVFPVLKENFSAANLYAADLDKDSSDEIILHCQLDAFGGAGQYQSYIFNLEGHQCNEIFSDKVIENEISWDNGCTAEFLAGKQLKIQNASMNYEKVIDISSQYSEDFFDATGKAKIAPNFACDPFYKFYPEDIDKDGVCEIVGYQYASVITHPDYIGDVQTVLKYNSETNRMDIVRTEFLEDLQVGENK